MKWRSQDYDLIIGSSRAWYVYCYKNSVFLINFRCILLLMSRLFGEHSNPLLLHLKVVSMNYYTVTHI